MHPSTLHPGFSASAFEPGEAFSAADEASGITRASTQQRGAHAPQPVSGGARDQGEAPRLANCVKRKIQNRHAQGRRRARVPARCTGATYSQCVWVTGRARGVGPLVLRVEKGLATFNEPGEFIP